MTKDEEKDPELADMAELLRESNEVRIRDLEAKTNGQASLENAFDALKMLVLLEHISLELGVKDGAELDFEGRRAEMLTKIETQYAQMLAAREAAERQARLAGGPVGRRAGVPLRPGPGGIVVPGQ